MSEATLATSLRTIATSEPVLSVCQAHGRWPFHVTAMGVKKRERRMYGWEKQQTIAASGIALPT